MNKDYQRIENAITYLQHNYGKIATSIGMPGASSAVGSAIGKNPVAYIIPCHRVIRESRVIGNYHWGKNVKRPF